MATPLGPRPVEETVAALRSTLVFGSLEEHVLRSIADASEWVVAEAGEAVCTQGAPADALYLLISGRLSVFIDAADGKERMVGPVYPGESVGEMAILSDERRSATVRARRDSVLLRLEQADFRELIPRHPAALLALNRLLVERLHALLQGQRPKIAERVIALVPACEGAPTRELAARLREVSGHRPLRAIDAATIRKAMDSPAPGPLGPDDRVARWLDEQEAHGGALLLLCDLEDEHWTRRSIRHADRLLLVGRSDAAPGDLPWLSAFTERSGAGAHQRRELALVQPDGAATPAGALRWLDALRVDLHHHVRLGVRSDLARLLRFLRGEAVGLALAGGAARGLAHVGVLRALEEAGVPVDFLCGTSMGAIIGAKTAMGWRSDEVHRSMRRGFGSWKIFDFTVPVLAACGGRWLEAHLRDTFADRRIEELWLPFRCVSSSLIRAEAVVHRRGPTGRAVLASSALPGVFPPVFEDDDILADGVLLDNLPVDLATEAGCGHVIAVNVINALDTTMARGLDRRGAPLQPLIDRLLPGGADRAPFLPDYVLRSFFLPTLRGMERIRERVSLYIEPPVDRFHYLDVRPFDEIIEVGYQEARERIAWWLDRTPGVPRD